MTGSAQPTSERTSPSRCKPTWQKHRRLQHSFTECLSAPLKKNGGFNSSDSVSSFNSFEVRNFEVRNFLANFFARPRWGDTLTP